MGSTSFPGEQILRHPDHVKTGVYLSSHHEKLVIIDQSWAFLGGVDLCYGRWDDYKHRLADLGSVSINMNKSVRTTSTYNYHPKTLMRLAKSTQELTVATLAKEDEMLLRSKIQVKSSDEEKANNECFEENGVTTDYYADKSTSTSGNDDSDGEKQKKNGKARMMVKKIKTFRGGRKKIQKTDANENSFGVVGSAKYWMGKDYTNFILKDFSKLDEPYEDLIDRITTPRMPWHDVCAAVGGRVARDAARHFIERWNFVKTSKVKKNFTYPFLVPKSYVDLKENIPSWITRHSAVDCQVIRSASHWSAGVGTEDSIHQAYCSAIRDSKHYIYIENQFFVSLATEDNDVFNKISQTLLERILRAHREGCRFRVYVVMPLLPGFEGEIKQNRGTALLAVCHWNYSSICRGPKSLMGKLREANIDPSEYITFYGLRNHSNLNGQLVTELIYVHSKLMIVDDNTVICGSANINDRSLIGKRDSEIAVIFQ
ncbi:hypothetical protein QYM36_006488, partial [Artemia franciscana]